MEAKIIDSMIKKIKERANAIRNLLPVYGEADITLRVETKEEVIGVAKKITATGKYHEPTEHLPYWWCAYQDGPVKITIQTHEEESGHNNAKTEYKIHSN